jgi:hypothetical protein
VVLVSASRAERVAAAFVDLASVDPQPRLCSVSADLMSVWSVGVTVMSGTHSGPVCSSNERATELESLQFTLGEGPCQDAFATASPVSAPDLLDHRHRRWTTFTPTALELGARGVFAYPLVVGRRLIGVMTLYQDAAGELTASQTADGPVVAAAVARTLLAIQSRADSQLLSELLVDGQSHRAEVHQASGMVSVQLGVSVNDALLRLRAHAFATGRPLERVAADVVARRLRLPHDGPRWEPK